MDYGKMSFKDIKLIVDDININEEYKNESLKDASFQPYADIQQTNRM